MYSDSENNQSETGKKLVTVDPDVVSELRATAPSGELITFVILSVFAFRATGWLFKLAI